MRAARAEAELRTLQERYREEQAACDALKKLMGGWEGQPGCQWGVMACWLLQWSMCRVRGRSPGSTEAGRDVRASSAPVLPAAHCCPLAPTTACSLLPALCGRQQLLDGGGGRDAGRRAGAAGHRAPRNEVFRDPAGGLEGAGQ